MNNIKSITPDLSQIKDNTPALKIGDKYFACGIGGNFIPGGSGDVQLGQIIQVNGVQKFISMSFDGTQASAGESQSFSQLYTYNTVNPVPGPTPSGDGSGTVYGVIYDPSSSSPICQKVVMNNGVLTNVTAFRHMSAHKFRRCVMDNLATRHVNYYLDPNDSNYKEDGTVATLTGADGDVMVEIPVTYWSVTEQQDGKILYLISDQSFTGSEPHPFFYVSPGGQTLRKQYVGAYEACLCDSSGNPLDTSNQNASSSSSYQSGYMARSLKGTKPWRNATRATARTAIHANGGYQVNALFHQYLMLMCMIEGGSLNTQATISPGYVFANLDYSSTRFSGRCNFGNGTGNLMCDPSQDSNISWQSVNDLLKIVQFQYRGIENPWGHLWSFVDGIVKEDGGYYMTTDCTAYTDAGYSSTYTWKDHSWQTDNDFVKTFDYKTFFAKISGGSGSTYLTDYFWSGSGSCTLIYGGGMNDMASAGAGYLSAGPGLQDAVVNSGFRVSA